MVVDLLPSYLGTLDAGNHTLTAEFDDGDAVTVAFTVREADATGGGESSNVPSGSGDAGGSTGGSVSRAAAPQTGDHATQTLFVALVLSAPILLLGGISTRLRREQ